ncbi:MAG: agmatine deiminase family protein [Saprospiraceae bacterium]|nr:agmatine deiminase family protein [Saprospiraceae bacterium]
MSRGKRNSFKAEFEPGENLLLSWNSKYNDLPYRKIATAVIQDGTRLIVVCRSARDRIQISNILKAYAIPTDSIRFLLFDFDSIWARDYTPLPVWTPDRKTGLSGYVYSKGKNRTHDANFPAFLHQELGLPLTPHDLILSGGNFVTNGQGIVICTDQLTDENAGQRASIGSFFTLHNAPRLLVIKKLEHEYTGHIDMLMKFVRPDVLLVAGLDPGMKDYPTMEENVQYIRSELPHCEVIEIPIAPDNGSYEHLGNVFYSYINSVILKKTVLLPLYGEATDDRAMDIYQNLFPGHIIEGIYCKDLVQLKGALHCMTAQF